MARAFIPEAAELGAQNVSILTLGHHVYVFAAQVILPWTSFVFRVKAHPSPVSAVAPKPPPLCKMQLRGIK